MTMFDFDRLSSFDTGLNELDRARDAVRRVAEQNRIAIERTRTKIEESALRLNREPAE